MTAPAPKRGRPPLPEGERLDVTVLTRWTAAEIAELDAAAERLGVKRATLIHDAALAKARRARKA
jgi:hypothetical protein